MVQPNAVSIRKLREWASRRHVIETSLAIGACPRLAQLCRRDARSGTIDASLSFRPGLEGFPLIVLAASGALKLDCQRCLKPVNWPIEIDCRLTVVGSENETENVASPYDTVVAGPDGVVLGTILEDEILTSLPMAPTHPHCEAMQDAGPELAPRACRPLANLGALMRRDGIEVAGSEGETDGCSTES